MDAWAYLHRFKSEWKLLVPVLFAAALGIGFGWYYYWQVGQFNPASPRFRAYGWWPLISDSPNAVLVWVVAVLAWKLRGWRAWWLDSLAFTLNVYVGLWTTTVFLLYPETMGTFDWGGAGACLSADFFADCNANPILFISHMGMPLLGLTMVQGLRQDRATGPAIGAILAGLALFVFVDYWGPHLHPAPFLHEHSHGAGALHAWAPWLMVVTAAAWLAVVRPSKPVVA